MSKHDSVIIWFRQDLRLADNPALSEAVKCADNLIPLFILDQDDPRTPGAASRWWLHESLRELRTDLEAGGADLILRKGGSLHNLKDLIGRTGATAVMWNRIYEPWARKRDRQIREALEDDGIEVREFTANVLCEPGTVCTQAGDPFRVFTPFWKALSNEVDQAATPLPAPPTLPPTPKGLARGDLAAWSLQPSRPDWAGGLRSAWDAGEDAASDRLDHFLEGAGAAYKSDRDRPDLEGTSRLSPHLHWGEISPGQIWTRTLARMGDGTLPEKHGWAFLRELGWREFSIHLLYHYPGLGEENFNERFDDFPWADDTEALERWQRGQTGYPIVDAGMRELWQTGWMHNRMRMVVASFLTKHLLIHWREGEAWFWDTLVDADMANNAAGWQWVAGSGADAAPYFRIFNPVLQGEKFDPEGAYVRRFVPELKNMPDKYIHKPWDAPAEVLSEADVTLGETYPCPMVDHQAARKRALSAYDEIKKDKAA